MENMINRLENELKGNMTSIHYLSRKKKIIHECYMVCKTREILTFYMDCSNTLEIIKGR